MRTNEKNERINSQAIIFNAFRLNDQGHIVVDVSARLSVPQILTFLETFDVYEV